MPEYCVGAFPPEPWQLKLWAADRSDWPGREVKGESCPGTFRVSGEDRAAIKIRVEGRDLRDCAQARQVQDLGKVCQLQPFPEITHRMMLEGYIRFCPKMSNFCHHETWARWCTRS